MSLRRALGMAMAGAMIISGTAAAFRQKAWAADTGKSSVSALMIQEVADGVGPFDADDRPGNDSGQSNGIVRSFDTIGYTLAYRIRRRAPGFSHGEDIFVFAADARRRFHIEL